MDRSPPPSYVSLRESAGTSSPPPSGSLVPRLFRYGSAEQPGGVAYSSDSDEPNGEERGGGGASWWSRLMYGHGRQEPAAQSAYLTLIPLSDSRLRPQHTRLIIGVLALVALFSVAVVYFAVSRGVTVGTIDVANSTISFNTTEGTYQIVLWTRLPIYNPNYASVIVSGRITVSFYDQQAGHTNLAPVTIPPRTTPHELTVDINSSSVPHKYLFTIYTQCFTFPEKLIFFLTADLKVAYLGTSYLLPRIDNYAIVDCNGKKESAQHSGGDAMPLAWGHGREGGGRAAVAGALGGGGVQGGGGATASSQQRRLAGALPAAGGGVGRRKLQADAGAGEGGFARGRERSGGAIVGSALEHMHAHARGLAQLCAMLPALNRSATVADAVAATAAAAAAAASEAAAEGQAAQGRGGLARGGGRDAATAAA